MANDFDLTRLVPRVLPLALRFGWAVAYGFGTVSQLNMGYRSSPAVQEGRPVVRRGPKVGDRLPDTHITQDGQVPWLGETLARPSFHLLLCGPVGSWDVSQLTVLRQGYASMLAVHQLTGEATPGALHDLDGQAFTGWVSPTPRGTWSDPTATSVTAVAAPTWTASGTTSPAGSPNTTSRPA